MININEVKQLDESKFEINFAVDGKEVIHIVNCDFFNVESGAPMPYFSPLTPGFFEIWGSDPKLRRKLSEMINAFS